MQNVCQTNLNDIIFPNYVFFSDFYEIPAIALLILARPVFATSKASWV